MRFSKALYLLPALLILPACDSDDPGDGEDPGEEELISRVDIRLVPQGGGDLVTLRAEDTNGDEILDVFTPTRAVLAAGQVYSGTATFTDVANDENVTLEIADEDQFHRVAYSISGVSGTTLEVTDADDNGYDLGLEFDLTTASTASGNGTLSLTLFHFDSPKTSDDEESDEIDVEVDFPISVD
jgi:hypothetical protein